MLTGMEIRSLTIPDEADRQLAVWNDVNPDDPLDLPTIEGWMSQIDDLAVFLAEEGEDAGVAWIGLWSRPAPLANVLVRPQHRRRGIGAALFARLTDWARSRGHEEIEATVRHVHEDGLAFAASLGFVEIGRDVVVELDLRDYDVPAIEPPPGVSIVAWAERPELARGIYEVAVEAYPDIPGEDESDIPSFDVWLERDMTGAGDKAEATFVAVAGDEVVGYSKFSLTDAQPTVAHHDLTGVKRAWRGRGVAGALKARQIAWAKEHGYERLVTGNEERNTPIRKLNERFGYKPSAAASRTTFRSRI